MINKYRQYIPILILLTACNIFFSRDNFSQNLTLKNSEFSGSSNYSVFFTAGRKPDNKYKLTLHQTSSDVKYSSYFDKKGKAQSVLPLSIGVLAAIYIINPIVEYTDKKVYLGFTKEFSIGWGKIGEHRTSLEYSMIFAGNIRHYLRASYKYDFLLKSGIEPSHMLQGTSVFTAGGGYFTDFNGRGGVFPELTYGYSIRNHKLLFYPHVKLRHTFMLNKDKPDITDLSFGIMLGIANPFIDVNIRRRYH